MCANCTSNVVIEWKLQQMFYIPETTISTLELNELVIFVNKASHCCFLSQGIY